MLVSELTVIESEKPDNIMGSEGLVAKRVENSIEVKGRTKRQKKTRKNSIWKVSLKENLKY